MTAWLLALGLVVGQDVAPGDGSAGADERGVDSLVDPNVRRDSLELDAALRALAERYAGLTLETLAASDEGRAVMLLRLHDPATGEASDKPGLGVVQGLEPQAGFEPEVVLAAVARLARDGERDPQVRGVLANVVVEFVLDADPDDRARALAGRTGSSRSEGAGIEIDRNFPAGWDPWIGGPAAGPYPLFRSEARALARWLSERGNLSVALVLRPTPAAERLGVVSAYGDDNARAGSLCEFVRRDLGGFAFRADTFLIGQVGPEEREREVELVRSVVLDLAARLPRVELELVARERLRDDLWQVDLVATNVGGLPTTGLQRPGARKSALILRTEGARVVAAATREQSAAEFVVWSDDPHELSLGSLNGGAAVAVRLVVQTPEPTGVAVFLSGERAGQARVDVPLE